MPAPHTDVRELARQAWLSIPDGPQRTANNVRKALKTLGTVDPVPSKGSINRWVDEWKKEPVTQSATVLMNHPETREDIPQVIADILAPRLSFVARGEGLDKVEDAVIKLSGAIAAKAEDIAAMLLDTESETVEVSTGEGDATSKKTIEKGKVARNAVACLTQLAQAMHTIASAKALVAGAHANFGIGDKAEAEAHVIRLTGRAESAKDITPSASERSAANKSAAKEAMDALRETVAKK